MLFVLMGTFAFSGQFEKGKKIFWEKCSVCHTGYIDAKKIKENFFEKNNSVLMLGAPSENMLVYAIMKGPKHIGDPTDPEMQQEEIEEYLQSYLYHPKRENSICDPHIMKFYDIKPPFKEKLGKEEISALARFFMEYKSHHQNKIKKSTPLPKISTNISSDDNEKTILSKARAGNKNILIEASSPTCFYCKKMKKEVIDTAEVQNILNKGYIYLDINVDSMDLPFDLAVHYKHITPSFFVLDKNGNLLSSYPGSLRKNDFLQILKHFRSKAGNQK
jgi:hypothetical protein